MLQTVNNSLGMCRVYCVADVHSDGHLAVGARIARDVEIKLDRVGPDVHILTPPYAKHVGDKGSDVGRACVCVCVCVCVRE